jgi:hypothetical protein
MEKFGKKSNIGHPDGHPDDSHPDYLTDHPFKNYRMRISEFNPD